MSHFKDPAWSPGPALRPKGVPESGAGGGNNRPGGGKRERVRQTRGGSDGDHPRSQAKRTLRARSPSRGTSRARRNASVAPRSAQVLNRGGTDTHSGSQPSMFKRASGLARRASIRACPAPKRMAATLSPNDADSVDGNVQLYGREVGETKPQTSRMEARCLSEGSSVATQTCCQLSSSLEFLQGLGAHDPAPTPAARISCSPTALVSLSNETTGMPPRYSFQPRAGSYPR